MRGANGCPPFEGGFTTAGRLRNGGVKGLGKVEATAGIEPACKDLQSSA